MASRRVYRRPPIEEALFEFCFDGNRRVVEAIAGGRHLRLRRGELKQLLAGAVTQNRMDVEQLGRRIALAKAPPIPRTRLQWRKADIAIGQAGVEATETAVATPAPLEEADIELPDILTELQDRTQLTRRSIHRVLVESQTLRDFQRNPQQFIAHAARAISECKQEALVDGIRYQRIGDGSYYAQELFQQEELTGYLRNMIDSGKSVYEKVVYESDVE